MRLEFHPEAELELIEAAAYYELQVPGLGERFEAEVRRAADFLLEHPEIGQSVDPDLHASSFPAFPSRYSTVRPMKFCASKWSHIKVACLATGAHGLTANRRIDADRFAAGHAERWASLRRS